MGLFDHFPYTNIHEMNLDWIMQMMKALEAAWGEFVAGNSLVFADPLLNDLTRTYAKNTIVLDKNGNAYVALKAVPVGVNLSNTEYWLMVFDYEAFLEKVNKNFTDRYYRDEPRAKAAMSVGDWLTFDDVLCKVTAAIAEDDLLEEGVNIEHFTLEDFIKAFMQSATQMIQQYKDDIDASELAYRQLLAQDIADTTASLQAQLDAVISGATVDSEVIDARVGADSVTYPTLGAAIRTQVTNLKNGYRAAWLNTTEQQHYVKNTDYSNRLTDITPVTGKYRNYQTGNIETNASYEYFDDIPVTPNTKYYVGFGGMSGGYQIVFFDEAGNAIPGFNKSCSAPGQYIDITIAYDSIIITTPANAVKMCYSMPITSAGDAVVIEYADYIDDFVLDLIPNQLTNATKICEPNLFCKEHICKNAYVQYNNGRVYTLSNWFYAVIPIEASTVYTRGGYSEAQVSQYDASGTRLWGVETSGVRTFTSEPTAKYFVLSAPMASLDGAFLCKGNVGKALPYGSGSEYSFSTGLREVGTGKKYATIQDAIDDANEYDTILIYPGTYTEEVVSRTKFLTIEGVERDLCILEYGDGDYQHCPLEISKGIVKNLTIKTINEALSGSDYAYGVHIDYDSSANTALYFENVYVHTVKTRCLGIGLRSNFNLTFNNCKFKCDQNEGSIFCHDDGVDRQSTGQRFNLINCTLENTSNTRAALMLQSEEYQDSEAILTAQRNIMINHGTAGLVQMYLDHASIGGGGLLNSTDWKLDPTSYMNMASDINN